MKTRTKQTTQPAWPGCMVVFPPLQPDDLVIRLQLKLMGVNIEGIAPTCQFIVRSIPQVVRVLDGKLPVSFSVQNSGTATLLDLTYEGANITTGEAFYVMPTDTAVRHANGAGMVPGTVHVI